MRGSGGLFGKALLENVCSFVDAQNEELGLLCKRVR
jgi:hypothetical protein